MGKKEDEPIGLQRGGPDPWSREARQKGRGTQRFDGRHGDESVSRDTVWIFSFQPRIDRGKNMRQRRIQTWIIILFRKKIVFKYILSGTY